MYSSIIAALAVTIILVMLVMAYVQAVTMQHSYYICKIARISIRCGSGNCYVSSSKPTIIHVFLIYESKIEHVICYTSCQVRKAPLIVAISPYDIAWRGDLSIVSKILYLSPCGVTSYMPNCWPWIRLPDLKTSIPTKLPLCNCTYRTVISGGVLGTCRIS